MERFNKTARRLFMTTKTQEQTRTEQFKIDGDRLLS